MRETKSEQYTTHKYAYYVFVFLVEISAEFWEDDSRFI